MYARPSNNGNNAEVHWESLCCFKLWEQTYFLVTCAELVLEIDAILATVMHKLVHKEWLVCSTVFSEVEWYNLHG